MHVLDKFLSFVSRLNVLFVHPNWHDYPVFCRRTNAEISFGYVRLSGRMKKLRYVWNIKGFTPEKHTTIYGIPRQ
jgi:hypothetical protein